MPAASSIAIAGLAIAAIGAGTTFVAQQQQAKAQEKATDLEKRRAAAQARRQRRATIREARVARGQALNTAGQVGAGESSGLSGGLSGIGAQLGSNLGFSTQTESIGSDLSRQGRKAASAGSLANIGRGVSSVGGALFSNSDRLSETFG